MKGELVFETLGGVDARFVLEAAPDAEIASAGAVSGDIPTKKEKRPFLHSGWVAAILCLCVGLGIYGGMMWLGRDSGQTPVGGTRGEETTQDVRTTCEEVTYKDHAPEYTEPCDFNFEITGMEIRLTYLCTESDETDGCLVDVYRDDRNVEYRFFSRTRVLKRFLDEERRITEDSCALKTVAKNAQQVVYDHAWLFWRHNHEAILEKKADNTYIYEIDHSIDNRFDKETLSMAFNAGGQLYAYTYEDHGFFSQCVARSNVELFKEIYEALPTGEGYLQMDQDDRLCYGYEKIVPMPPEEQITDEEGIVIGPGCGDHKHVFIHLPILSINPPEKPPLPPEMIFGFSYEIIIEEPEYLRTDRATLQRGQSFRIDGGMYFDEKFETKPYNGSDDLFPTVTLIAKDGSVIESNNIASKKRGYHRGHRSWSASRLFEIPADAPVGKYDIKVSYGEKFKLYEDVLTITE